MNVSDEGPRSPLCRLADRLGFTASLPEERRQAGGREGLLSRWVDQHVDRCPRCRAERAEWAKTVELLRRAGRPTAPATLLQGVMAQIAAERARTPAVRNRRVAGGAMGPWEQGAAMPVWALLCGWVGFVSASATVLGLFHRIAGAASASLGNAAVGVGAQLRILASALPPGWEPYAIACLWSVVGLGIALAIPRVVGESAA